MTPKNRTFTLAVASGKGGTGKTLVATSLAALADAEGVRATLVDCDVEAPNDHLFFRGSASSRTTVSTTLATIDAANCTGCGSCRDACAYGAVRVFGGTAVVFEELCHGCGLCQAICPAAAITETNRRVGEVETWRPVGRKKLRVVTGRLDVGQVKTPAVIRAAREVAVGSSAPALVILDAPPGVACAAVASVRRADALLLVTESTPFGLHDLELSLQLGSELGLPMGVLLNRYTGGSSEELDRLCSQFGASIVARIPFDRRIAEVYARGGLVIEELPEVHSLLADVLTSMRTLARGAVNR
ncbi:MAG: P-loop NTPase [Coriobacteriia bacterium]